MPVITRETAMYKIVQIVREPTIPMGRSRCGLRVSSAAVATNNADAKDNQVQGAKHLTQLKLGLFGIFDRLLNRLGTQDTTHPDSSSSSAFTSTSTNIFTD